MSKNYEMSDGAAIGIFAAGVYAGNSIRKLVKATFESGAKKTGVNVSGRLGRELFYSCFGLGMAYITMDVMFETYGFCKRLQKRGDSRRAQQNADTVAFTGEEEEEEYTDE